MRRYHYYLYFAGFDGVTEQIGVAVSDDLKTWTMNPDPILPVGKPGEWDSFQTSNPSVWYENRRFRMWFQGVDDDSRYRFGYAESEDGWTWEKRPDIALFEPEGLSQPVEVPWREGYHQPLVLKEAHRYLMYYIDHHDKVGVIRVAESSDGFSWTPHEHICLSPEKKRENLNIYYPWVIYDGRINQYVMWYTCIEQGRVRELWTLSRAVSEDGIHWKREPEDQAVIDLPDVRKASLGHYWMPRRLLNQFENYRPPEVRAVKKKPPVPGGLYGKIVINLYDRVIYPFRARRFVSFNNGSVVKQKNGSYLMFYQAFDENGFFSIGSAESHDGIQWKPLKTRILHPEIENLLPRTTWAKIFDADPHLLVMDE